MYVSHDALADAMYVSFHLPEGGDSHADPMDSGPIRCIDKAGNVYAYEFLFVSAGISLEGIDPEDTARIHEVVRTAITALEPLAGP